MRVLVWIFICFTFSGCSYFPFQLEPPRPIRYYQYEYTNKCEFDIHILTSDTPPLKMKQNEQTSYDHIIGDTEMLIKVIEKNGKEITGEQAYQQSSPTTYLIKRGKYEFYCTNFCSNGHDFEPWCLENSEKVQLFAPDNISRESN